MTALLGALVGAVVALLGGLAAHQSIDEETAQAMEDSGFERIRDEDYFMTHLKQFVDFLTDSGNDDMRQALAQIARRRLLARGLSTDEPLRREAWDEQGAALARIADLPSVVSVERAYGAIDRAATVIRESEPTILTGEFFDVGMRGDLLAALRRLAALGRLEDPAIDGELAELSEASEPWWGG